MGLLSGVPAAVAPQIPHPARLTGHRRAVGQG